VRQVGQLPRIIAWCTVNKTLKSANGLVNGECQEFGRKRL